MAYIEYLERFIIDYSVDNKSIALNHPYVYIFFSSSHSPDGGYFARWTVQVDFFIHLLSVLSTALGQLRINNDTRLSQR